MSQSKPLPRAHELYTAYRVAEGNPVIELEVKRVSDVDFSTDAGHYTSDFLGKNDAEQRVDAVHGRRSRFRRPRREGKASDSRSATSAASGSDVVQGGRTANMTGMDREYVTPRELAAEIRAIEERMDRRHAEIGGKIDVLATSINSAVEKITTEVKSANERVVSTQRDLEGNFAKMAYPVSSCRPTSGRWPVRGRG
jgi:hypothetical protein